MRGCPEFYESPFCAAASLSRTSQPQLVRRGHNCPDTRAALEAQESKPRGRRGKPLHGSSATRAVGVGMTDDHQRSNAATLLALGGVASPAQQALWFALSSGFAQRRPAHTLPVLLKHWRALTDAAVATRTDSVLAHVLHQGQLLDGTPRKRAGDDRMSPVLWTAQTWSDHLDKRAAMLDHLEHAVRALNAHGLTPLLLKGARTLWLGAPAWRSMRDLDLLMASREDSDSAQALLAAEGYVERGEHGASFHHANNLYRDDFPGWIEIHRRAGPPRVELLLPTKELLAAAVPWARGQLQAFVLPASLDVLFGVVHHHFGHREARDGVLGIKGLFEFAMGVSALLPEGRTELAGWASRDCRLLATLDLWLAAARERLSFTEISPLVVPADADARWVRLRSMTARPGKVAALGEELKLALAPPRLRRCRSGDRVFGRTMIRIRTIAWAATAFGARHY